MSGNTGDFGSLRERDQIVHDRLECLERVLVDGQSIAIPTGRRPSLRMNLLRAFGGTFSSRDVSSNVISLRLACRRVRFRPNVPRLNSFDSGSIEAIPDGCEARKRMAIPTGLEPVTYCLEGSCSFQLS